MSARPSRSKEETTNLDGRTRRIDDLVEARRILADLMGHDRLSREELKARQRRRIRQLVRTAVDRSPFYRELYGRTGHAFSGDLRALPPVDKRLMLEHFDRLVTDRRLRLRDLQAHLDGPEACNEYLDEFRVVASSGSSGVKSIVVYGREDWRVLLAAWLRCAAMAGIGRTEDRAPGVAVLGPLDAFHVSRALNSSLQVGLRRSLLIDALVTLDQQVRALNEFDPAVLFVYPSIATLLAQEQLEGRLRIDPKVVVTFGFWCTDQAARTIRAAWGRTPHNYYALTEGIVGIDCSHHRGIHVFEDLCVLEVVDERGLPVPDGSCGDKVLFTNLFNSTQPLIRFEITDLVTMETDPCPCGRPYPLIRAIEGRGDELILLQDSNGRPARAHSVNFVLPIEALGGVKQHQVLQDEDGLHVVVVPKGGVAREALAAEVIAVLRRQLETRGFRLPAIDVRFSSVLPGDPSAGGKLRPVVSTLTGPLARTHE